VVLFRNLSTIDVEELGTLKE